MKWIIKVEDIYGQSQSYNIPFSYQQVVYYAHQKTRRKKWAVSVCVVTGIWAESPGIYGIILDDKMKIPMV